MEKEAYPLLPSSHFKVVLKKPSKDGLVACACWNTHTILGWKRSHYLIVILAPLITFAIFLAYFVAIGRKEMPAFLPFVSQAAGHPPMNGIFAVPMITSSFFGYITIVLLYESINHRNIYNDKKIKILNFLGLLIICIGFVGFIVTTVFPVGYTEFSNKFDWIVTVLFEHSMGASMILIGASLFQFITTGIWYFLPDATKAMKYFRIFLSGIFVILFLMTAKPMPDYIKEEMGPRGFDVPYMKNITYRLPLEFSTNYLLCSFAEWAVCLLGVLNFSLLYKDMKRISFHVVIRHKSCFMDTMETAPSITLKC